MQSLHHEYLEKSEKPPRGSWHLARCSLLPRGRLRRHNCLVPPVRNLVAVATVVCDNASIARQYAVGPALSESLPLSHICHMMTHHIIKSASGYSAFADVTLRSMASLSQGRSGRTCRPCPSWASSVASQARNSPKNKPVSLRLVSGLLAGCCTIFMPPRPRCFLKHCLTRSKFRSLSE